MGSPAGFEEKEFETLANATLVFDAKGMANNMPTLFSPGQALERALGFDFSIYVDPTSRTYKLLFGDYPGPSTPGATTPPPNLPASTDGVNTFIQYKRPEYFKPSHRQPVWHGQSFLRFGVRSKYRVDGRAVTDHTQLEALDRLASANPNMKVRYACPSVWTRKDLYEAYAQQSLFSKCAFTDPRNLSKASNGIHYEWHDYWTYQPTNPALGRPNPSGPLKESQTGEGFLDEVRQSVFDYKGKNFIAEIFDLKSVANETLKESRFFESKPDRHSRTKKQYVSEAVRSIKDDFLDSPRNNSWLVDATVQSYLPARPPRGDEIEQIEAVVEVAAFARELGATWMTASTS